MFLCRVKWLYIPRYSYPWCLSLRVFSCLANNCRPDSNSLSVGKTCTVTADQKFVGSNPRSDHKSWSHQTKWKIILSALNTSLSSVISAVTLGRLLTSTHNLVTRVCLLPVSCYNYNSCYKSLKLWGSTFSVTWTVHLTPRGRFHSISLKERKKYILLGLSKLRDSFSFRLSGDWAIGGSPVPMKAASVGYSRGHSWVVLGLFIKARLAPHSCGNEFSVICKWN